MQARALLLALCLTSASVIPEALAQQVGSNEPILMTADDLSFDEDLGTATARGNVEIVQGGRILNADSVTYNQRDDIVTASGNVVLLEPTGEILFAESLNVNTGDGRKAAGTSLLLPPRI